MTNKTMNENESTIDLTSLKGFSLEPNWDEIPEKENKKKKTNYQQEHSLTSKTSKSKERKFKKKSERYSSINKVEITVRPRKEILNIIKEKIKTTGVSYSIKEICNTISEKKNRLGVQIEFITEKDFFTINKSTGKCFWSRKEAIDDMIYNHGKDYISSTVISESEFKKGVDYALQCKTTKKLFPPPSFHCFESLVRNHLFESSINKDYNSYVSGLLKVENQETIDDLLKTKMQTFEYKYVASKDKIYSSIESIKSDILKELSKEHFTTKKKVFIDYSDLNTLPPQLQKDIDILLSDKRSWGKEFFVTCLILFKKSKLVIYKKQNSTFVCNSIARSIDTVSLNKKSTLIIDAISEIENSTIEIKKLISNNKLATISTTELLKELKWLVKEGYVREFSNSSVCLA